MYYLEESREERELNNIEVHTKRGITGSTLKLIALAAMLIDHVGAVILEPIIINNSMTYSGLTGIAKLYTIDQVMRLTIGRIAFPIYCFLLIEGFQKTSNRYRYAGRLLLFAIVSEIPFDLALADTWLSTNYQNVFFTLFLGLAVMIGVEKVKLCNLNKWITGILDIGILFVGMLTADLLCTDYGGYGVLCITVLYLFRGNRKRQILAGSIAFVGGDYLCHGSLSELLAPLGFVLISFYNGERGLKLKYIFYLFYPLHLLVLYGVRILIL